MTEFWMMFIAGLVGTVGFGIMFHAGPKALAVSVFGSAVVIFVYEGCSLVTGELLSNVAASTAAALYAMLMARLIRTPSTVILTPELIPLVPGRSLYYAISSMIARQYTVGVEYLRTTVEVALGIAIGIVLSGTVDAILIHTGEKIKKRRAVRHS